MDRVGEDGQISAMQVPLFELINFTDRKKFPIVSVASPFLRQAQARRGKKSYRGVTYGASVPEWLG